MRLPMDEEAYQAELKAYGDGAEWREASYEANGIKIVYYHSIPAMTLPKLFFVHGRGSCGATCLPFLAPLTDNFQVFVPDARAYGKSQPCPPGSFTMTNMIADVAALIKHISPENPVFLIGHSMGASVSARVSKQHPELVKALILEDPPWRQLPGQPAPLDGLPPGGGPVGGARRARQLSEEEFLKQDKESEGDLFPPPYKSMLWAARVMDIDAVEHAFMKEHLEPLISEAVIGLGMPVLITRAAHMNPEVAKKVLEGYPRGEIVYFPGEGLHVIHAPPTGKKWQEDVKGFLLRVLNDRQ